MKTPLNDNFFRTIVRFHPYRRWCAITIDDVAMGYMAVLPDGSPVVTMHLKKDSPQWLREVRDRGPYMTFDQCQAAILGAKPERLI